MAAGAIATVLAGLTLVHVLAAVPGRGGPAVYYLGGCVAAGVAFVLLVRVMRTLLLAAIADRADLDGLI